MFGAVSGATLLADPATFSAVVVAVVLVGLSKGGLGGAFAMMGVPIMVLVMPPLQALALMLPVLLMMDAVSLWAWRGWYDRATLLVMLPGALLGIALGALAAAFTSDAAVRVLVGMVALGFVVRMALARRDAPAKGQSGWRGGFWGAVAGFTSFVAHAGRPPFDVYALPLRFDPRVLAGTSVIFFAVVNAVKLLPYAILGQFDREILLTAGVMLPVAVLATLMGAWIVRRMRAEVFYPVMYAMLALVGLRLVWDGARGLLGG